MKVKVLRPCDQVAINGRDYEVENGAIEVPESVGRDILRRFPDHYAPYEKKQEKRGTTVLENIKEVK